jgi:hypothetical protein
MKFQIGFSAEDKSHESTAQPITAQSVESAPVKSVVQVYFESRNRTLAYFNDRFDLHAGDLVYVDGKLSGLRGRVASVQYNFKIKLSDYQRVIAVADTNVCGALYLALSHLVAFDPTVLPREKIATWFLPPAEEETSEYISGNDDFSFPLDDLHEMHLSGDVAARGHAYYMENRVRYLCLDGEKGYAIVEGTQPYELEFTCQDGAIRALTCSCFCASGCKHEFAAMLQLQETVQFIEEHYAEAFHRSAYFAAISKASFFSYAMDGRKTGCLTLT